MEIIKHKVLSDKSFVRTAKRFKKSVDKVFENLPVDGKDKNHITYNTHVPRKGLHDHWSNHSMWNNVIRTIDKLVISYKMNPFKEQSWHIIKSHDDTFPYEHRYTKVGYVFNNGKLVFSISTKPSKKNKFTNICELALHIPPTR